MALTPLPKNGEEYYVYWINVKTKQVKYQIPRRFKEFYDLYGFLKNNRGISYNQFPKRTFFALNSLPKLEKRRQKLDSFLQFLHAECKRRTIPEFFDFIEIEEFTV